MRKPVNSKLIAPPLNEAWYRYELLEDPTVAHLWEAEAQIEEREEEQARLAMLALAEKLDAEILAGLDNKA